MFAPEVGSLLEFVFANDRLTELLANQIADQLQGGGGAGDREGRGAGDTRFEAEARARDLDLVHIEPARLDRFFVSRELEAALAEFYEYDSEFESDEDRARRAAQFARLGGSRRFINRLGGWSRQATELERWGPGLTVTISFPGRGFRGTIELEAEVTIDPLGIPLPITLLDRPVGRRPQDDDDSGFDSGDSGGGFGEDVGDAEGTESDQYDSSWWSTGTSFGYGYAHEGGSDHGDSGSSGGDSRDGGGGRFMDRFYDSEDASDSDADSAGSGGGSGGGGTPDSNSDEEYEPPPVEDDEDEDEDYDADDPAWIIHSHINDFEKPAGADDRARASDGGRDVFAGTRGLEPWTNPGRQDPGRSRGGGRILETRGDLAPWVLGDPRGGGRSGGRGALRDVGLDPWTNPKRDDDYGDGGRGAFPVDPGTDPVAGFRTVARASRSSQSSLALAMGIHPAALEDFE